jgi:hypothetical protein
LTKRVDRLERRRATGTRADYVEELLDKLERWARDNFGVSATEALADGRRPPPELHWATRLLGVSEALADLPPRPEDAGLSPLEAVRRQFERGDPGDDAAAAGFRGFSKYEWLLK